MTKNTGWVCPQCNNRNYGPQAGARCGFCNTFIGGETSDDCEPDTDIEDAVESIERKGKKIYVCGKMRGVKDYNFPAFDRAERILRNMGHHPVSPAAMDRLFEGWGAAPPEGVEFTPQDCKRFILRDLVALMDCDAICRLPGWQDSKGAKLEIALAEFLGLEEVEI